MDDKNHVYSVKELTGFLGIDSLNGKTPEIDDVDLSSLIQSYQKLGSCFFMVTDFSRMAYVYVSPSASVITGYPVEMWMQGGLSFAFSIHHPVDMASQKLIHKEIIRYHHSLSVEERLKYRYCFTMRIRRSDGKFIRLLGQMICLKLDQNGNPKYVLELFTDITLFDQDGVNALTISKYDENTGFSEIVYYYAPEEITRGFSKRESEINRLVNSGFTSEEIAKKLGLSKNTVNTYRQKIKKKHKGKIHL